MNALHKGFYENENGKEQIQLGGKVIKGDWIDGYYFKHNNRQLAPIDDELTEKAFTNYSELKTVIFVATTRERDSIVTPALKAAGLDRDDSGVWVVRTGVGKVDATLISTAFLSLIPKHVSCINVGVVGGNEKAAKDHPCVVIDRVYNHDFDTSVVDGLPFDKPFLQLTKQTRFRCFTQDSFETQACRIASGFYSRQDEKLGISIKQPRTISENEPFYVDMELYGIARVCERLGFRLTAIKAVSDALDSGTQAEQYNGDRYKDACDLASKELMKCLINKESDFEIIGNKFEVAE